MGIYPDHGLEYHLVLRDERHIVVICSKETDDRLVESEYYKSRKGSWFQDLSTRCKLIEESVDIQLTDAEKAKLDMMMKSHGENIVSHGWHDVLSISYSH